MLSAVLSGLNPSSPWFFVMCGVLLLAGGAVVVYCLLRRPKFHQSESVSLESLVGKIGIVTEEVDSDAGTGLVTVDGEGWAARSVYTDDVYSVGTQVKVLAIEGVKLIVKPVD